MSATSRVCAALVLTSIGLSGCTSIEKVLPQDGPTMLEIYEGHLDQTGTTTPQATGETPIDAPIVTPEGAGLLRAKYQQSPPSAYLNVDALFPELPNPKIVMYVYPHLATDARVPVPGYMTAFRMYERAEFALPGEAGQ